MSPSPRLKWIEPAADESSVSGSWSHGGNLFILGHQGALCKVLLHYASGRICESLLTRRGELGALSVCECVTAGESAPLQRSVILSANQSNDNCRSRWARFTKCITARQTQQLQLQGLRCLSRLQIGLSYATSKGASQSLKTRVL